MAKMAPRGSGVYETIRAAVDLADVVSLFAELEDQGDMRVCFCPLKEQSSKSPAFKIYGDRFFCFSCGARGDVVDFWHLKHEFPSCWEAAQDLASKYDVELPQVSPEARASYEERRRKEDEYARVAAERHAALKDPNNATGAKARSRTMTASPNNGKEVSPTSATAT